MNILHVCGSFPPAYAYGGPPRSIHHLTSSLADRGHDVTVYTTDAKDEHNRVDIERNPILLNGVEVHRFRNVSNQLAWRNIQIPPTMISTLLRNISEFDVVHSHEFRSPPMVFAHIAAKRAGVPHAHQPRGSVPRYDLRYLKWTFDMIIGKRIVHEADQLISSSRTESANYSNVFSGLSQEKIRSIPNGISSESYQNLPESGMFRRTYGIDSEERIILFLSRLHPRKGGDLLIDAVGELPLENLRLVFVGPDEGARHDWESLAQSAGIADRTLFVGPLYDIEKLRAYRDADVFVLPSKNDYESFGNVVLEAMACGTPVVVTNVCGISEWLDHDSCRTVEPTSQAIGGGLESTLNKEPSSFESIRQYVLTNFRWEAIAEDTESMYEGLI